MKNCKHSDKPCGFFRPNTGYKDLCTAGEHKNHTVESLGNCAFQEKRDAQKMTKGEKFEVAFAENYYCSIYLSFETMVKMLKDSGFNLDETFEGRNENDPN